MVTDGYIELFTKLQGDCDVSQHAVNIITNSIYKRTVKNEKKLSIVNSEISDCETRSQQGISDRETEESDIEEL